jgi:hypothetical protein
VASLTKEDNQLTESAAQVDDTLTASGSSDTMSDTSSRKRKHPDTISDVQKHSVSTSVIAAIVPSSVESKCGKEIPSADRHTEDKPAEDNSIVHPLSSISEIESKSKSETPSVITQIKEKATEDKALSQAADVKAKTHRASPPRAYQNSSKGKTSPVVSKKQKAAASGTAATSQYNAVMWSNLVGSVVALHRAQG